MGNVILHRNISAIQANARANVEPFEQLDVFLDEHPYARLNDVAIGCCRKPCSRKIMVKRVVDRICTSLNPDHGFKACPTQVVMKASPGIQADETAVIGLFNHVAIDWIVQKEGKVAVQAPGIA